MTAPEDQPVIMRTLVGSQAYGLARPDSDNDYREVFIIPTRELLGLDFTGKSGWQSGHRDTDDEGGWELGHWLKYVYKGSPNATELIWAPLEDIEEGRGTTATTPDEIRALAHSLLSREVVGRSTLGYAKNSFRKIEGKGDKWRTGYLRSLMMGHQLMKTGWMQFPLPEGAISTLESLRWKTDGEVLDEGQKYERVIERMMKPGNEVHSVLPYWEDIDLKAANDKLYEIRMRQARGLTGGRRGGQIERR